MNLEFLDKVPYLCDRWSEYVKSDPKRIVLVDGVRPGGVSRMRWIRDPRRCTRG